MDLLALWLLWIAMWCGILGAIAYISDWLGNFDETEHD